MVKCNYLVTILHDIITYLIKNLNINELVISILETYLCQVVSPKVSSNCDANCDYRQLIGLIRL